MRLPKLIARLLLGCILLAGCTSGWFNRENANAVQPSRDDVCVSVIDAIDSGDLAVLARHQIPSAIEDHLLTGPATTTLCGGDNLAGEFVLSIEREGAQVVVIRNTSRTLLSEQPSAVAAALEAVGGRTGSFLIEENKVIELTPVGNTELVPIAAILK